MKIFKKGSKLYSILFNKCPRCNNGDVFTSSNPYHLGKMFSMHETCPNCGLRYEIEPAFFYGAMYVSYGYTVAVAVATFIIMNIIYSPGIWDVVIALAIILLIGSPYILRISRITYLNLFVKYNPEKRGPSHK